MEGRERKIVSRINGFCQTNIILNLFSSSTWNTQFFSGPRLRISAGLLMRDEWMKGEKKKCSSYNWLIINIMMIVVQFIHSTHWISKRLFAVLSNPAWPHLKTGPKMICHLIIMAQVCLIQLAFINKCLLWLWQWAMSSVAVFVFTFFYWILFFPY